MKLVDGESMFDLSYQDFLRSSIYVSVARRRNIVVPPLLPINISGDRPVMVMVSQGRMLAQCPNCNNAEYVWRNGPHLILCANCGNNDIGNKYRVVFVPEDFPQIETLLLQRPDPNTQNWTADESTTDLAIDNERYL